MIINLDPAFRQSGWIEVDRRALPFELDQPYFLHDLLSGQRFVWQGPRGFVILDPLQAPAHVFRVEARLPDAPAVEATA